MIEFFDEKIIHEYFEWMYNMVYNDRYSKSSKYSKLFRYLFEKEFYYLIPMDGNRAEDGINLRYTFGREMGYDDPVIASSIDNRPCSVLEMMIALALRCEVHIMDDPDLGNRVGQWFWEMIVNLGLGHMTDSKFDRDEADEIMYIFLERKYGRDGTGGLFRVSDSTKDMRSTEIWYQMCWHLNEVLEGQI